MRRLLATLALAAALTAVVVAGLAAAGFVPVWGAGSRVRAATLSEPWQDRNPVRLPGQQTDAERAAGSSPLLAPPATDVPGSIADLRLQMVRRLVDVHHIDQGSVLRAMEEVPRHLFVPEAYRGQAYEDVPLPMGWGQTVYQPYIVALMTSLADLGPEDTVLEIGTGSGYHTAVLSRVAGKVYSIEISEPIAERARERLQGLGYRNIELRVGDGYEGWAEKAPFDAVILTAAPPYLPEPLIEQLKVGGKMVAPVGEYFQDLRVITKTPDGLESEPVIPVRVSPMEGEVRGEGNG